MRRLLQLNLAFFLVSLSFFACDNGMQSRGGAEVEPYSSGNQRAVEAELALSGGLSSGEIVNGIQWADTDGNPIQAHGGGFIKVGAYYYWFGENRNTDYSFKSVNCYRSTDLKTWEYRGNALSSGSAAELNFANIERPKVVYNASTGKYVMWMHWENGIHYGEARAAVASSSSVEGPYEYHGSFRPYADSGVMDHGLPGYMSRDCNLFVDADGTAYFISSSNENMDLHLYRLTGDYLSIDTLVTKLFVGNQREAPVLFRRNGHYFLLTSGCTGWSPNQAKYSVSPSLASGWSSLANVGDSTTFHSQPTYVVPVQGSSGTSYLYAGDRWAGAWSGPYLESAYVWMPITFPTDTTMSMTWSNALTLNASIGTISGTNAKFMFLNKNSGKAMEVSGYSMADGGLVTQYARNNGNNQKWSLNYDGAGYFTVVNANSGKLLDVTSSSTADGAKLIQWASNGGGNQKWRLVDLGGGSFQLRNKNSGKMVDVPNASTSYVQLVQNAASSASSQVWQMITQ